ncbi:MAG: hypothetical protein VKK04_09885 [Synechococcales bacterium]|nr:hypothetical protein [Synechococcales bacterium]
MQLLTSADLKQSSSYHPCLYETEKWVRDFLGNPHPELGRPGPVCPFVPRALQQNTVYFSAVPANGGSVDELTALVATYCHTFLELEPKTGPLSVYKSILLIFPDVETQNAGDLIDVVQQNLKPLFVDQGLMIGEFHGRSNSPGLHNPIFRPLRSPIPMLAIRFMAESDLPFLSRMTDSAELRLRYLRAYINRMSMANAARALPAAEAAIAMAEAELKDKAIVPSANESPLASTTKAITASSPLTELSPPPEEKPSRTCPFRRLKQWIDILPTLALRVQRGGFSLKAGQD